MPGYSHKECQVSRATAKAEGHTTPTLPKLCALPAGGAKTGKVSLPEDPQPWPHSYITACDVPELETPPAVLDLPTVTWTRRY